MIIVCFLYESLNSFEIDFYYGVIFCNNGEKWELN